MFRKIASRRIVPLTGACWQLTELFPSKRTTIMNLRKNAKYLASDAAIAPIASCACMPQKRALQKLLTAKLSASQALFRHYCQTRFVSVLLDTHVCVPIMNERCFGFEIYIREGTMTQWWRQLLFCGSVSNEYVMCNLMLMPHLGVMQAPYSFHAYAYRRASTTEMRSYFNICSIGILKYS